MDRDREASIEHLGRSYRSLHIAILTCNNSMAWNVSCKNYCDSVGSSRSSHMTVAHVLHMRGVCHTGTLSKGSMTWILIYNITHPTSDKKINSKDDCRSHGGICLLLTTV